MTFTEKKLCCEKSGGCGKYRSNLYYFVWQNWNVNHESAQCGTCLDWQCNWRGKYLNNFSKKTRFLTFPACFSIPIIFSNFDFNCSNLWSLRNLQEQVKKAFSYQNLFWPFIVWIKCSRDLKNFEGSQPSATDFKSFFSITRTIFSHCRSEKLW